MILCCFQWVTLVRCVVDGVKIYFLYFFVLLTSVFIALIVLCGNDWSIIHIFLQESND